MMYMRSLPFVFRSVLVEGLGLSNLSPLLTGAIPPGFPFSVGLTMAVFDILLRHRVWWIEGAFYISGVFKVEAHQESSEYLAAPFVLSVRSSLEF